MDRNYRDALSQVTICMVDVCTESMNNRVTETNRVAFSAPTDRRELCVSRNKRRRARLVGYVCSSQEKQNLFCLLQHLPFYVHFPLTGENTHSHELCFWKLHKSSTALSLFGWLIWFFLFQWLLPACLFVSNGPIEVHVCVCSCMGLKYICLLWQPCHFLFKHAGSGQLVNDKINLESLKFKQIKLGDSALSILHSLI